jgi:putative transposase
MVEAFIKTFKRDYIHINPLFDVRTVIQQLSILFEDYNENHPYKSLDMWLPREYKKFKTKLEECTA